MRAKWTGLQKLSLATSEQHDSCGSRHIVSFCNKENAGHGGKEWATMMACLCMLPQSSCKTSRDRKGQETAVRVG